MCDLEIFKKKKPHPLEKKVAKHDYITKKYFNTQMKAS